MMSPSDCQMMWCEATRWKRRRCKEYIHTPETHLRLTISDWIFILSLDLFLGRERRVLSFILLKRRRRGAFWRRKLNLHLLKHFYCSSSSSDLTSSFTSDLDRNVRDSTNWKPFLKHWISITELIDMEISWSSDQSGGWIRDNGLLSYYQFLLNRRKEDWRKLPVLMSFR